MKIIKMRVNHVENPVGYEMKAQTFSWQYVPEGEQEGEMKECRVEIAQDLKFGGLFFDSGFSDKISNISYELELKLKPCTRYYWRVTARLGSGETVQSNPSFFETGKGEEPWTGKWICMEDKGKESPIVRKSFSVKKQVKRAVIYVSGLGLYECSLNGTRINDGYLQPGFHNYHFWIQYQTYDVTGVIKAGENVLSFLLGAGWYKGRFGVNGGFYNNFGEHYHIICELQITYADGEKQVIGSDESFLYREGPVVSSGIYDGEVYDATLEEEGWMLPGFDPAGFRPVKAAGPKKPGLLTERYSVPVVGKERIRPAAVLKGKNNEVILDMGQNMTGWLVFLDPLKKGQKLTLKYAEHMQDGELCRENLLTAKQEFVYISDGKNRLVRPHFTYFGFRYVQVEGLEGESAVSCFEGENLYSDLEMTGTITTGNDLVNKFIQNALWSQKDNFTDHPTDCPQRSERLGWTGDAQIYCAAASFHMYTPAFYRKYIKDVNLEQEHKNGMVPFIVPKIKGRGMEDNGEECSAGWSDAAVIIPWTMYVFYGDKNLLKEEYPGMKAWVEYMLRKDEEDGGKRLWQTGFHFGDWLALDNPKPGPFGQTDPFYIASCYYYYSTKILAKAAKVLGNQEDADKYGALYAQIQKAVQKEYFDDKLICKQDTQTAYALALYMDIIPREAFGENGKRLAAKIEKNGGHLDTGFIGTAYLSLALSKAGYSRLAYDLLLKEDFPSWLYQVKLGATTIWESWRVLDEDGRLTEPASLNHYAFGVVVQWMYQKVCGIHPLEEYPGFQKVLIEPNPDKRLGEAGCILDTPAGTYEAGWKLQEDETAKVRVVIPYQAAAWLKLPDAEDRIELLAGTYEFFCKIG